MRRPDPALQADRRRQILDAGFACFAETGIQAATMQRIAEAAGMSPANLYRYFSSKQALLEALVEEDLLGERALWQAAAEAPAAERVAALMALILRRARLDEGRPLPGQRSHAAVFIEIAAEICRQPALARRHAEETDAIRLRLAQVWSGEPEPGPMALAAAGMLQVMANGLAWQWVLSGEGDLQALHQALEPLVAKAVALAQG